MARTAWMSRDARSISSGGRERRRGISIMKSVSSPPLGSCVGASCQSGSPGLLPEFSVVEAWIRTFITPPFRSSGFQQQVGHCIPPLDLAARTLPQVTHVLVQVALEFLEREAIDLALEVHHRL